MVVIGLPTTAPTAIWHERRGASPISTVQAPHCPSPHPYFAPVSPSSSRKTYSSGVSRSYCTGYFSPFTSNSIGFGMFPPGRELHEGGERNLWADSSILLGRAGHGN